MISGSFLFVSLHIMSYCHLFSALVTDLVVSCNLHDFLMTTCERFSSLNFKIPYAISIY